MIQRAPGSQIRFGSDQNKGVALNEFGECEIVDVAEVGVERLLVHDEHRPDPTLAFALSRLASAPTMPTPVGVFRDIARPSYEAEVQRQLVDASQKLGPGDLTKLLESGGVWDVG